MPALTIDVDGQIENLRGLKIDLEEYFWSVDERADQSTRYALGVAISEIARRMAALEEVVRHIGSDEVGLNVSGDVARTIERALRVLDGEFVADPTAPDDKMWTRIRALLEAADDVLLASARGSAIRSGRGDGRAAARNRTSPRSFESLADDASGRAECAVDSAAHGE
jgi:hypothetical protein